MAHNAFIYIIDFFKFWIFYSNFYNMNIRQKLKMAYYFTGVFKKAECDSCRKHEAPIGCWVYIFKLIITRH